jgi:hypothetical protein
VRSLAELVGLDVHWKIDMGAILPDTASWHYVLFSADEPVGRR